MMEQNGVYADQYDENGYMDQEDEWEREGLLDPAWEKQQKKVSVTSLVREFLWISKRRKLYCVQIIKKEIVEQ